MKKLLYLSLFLLSYSAMAQEAKDQGAEGAIIEVRESFLDPLEKTDSIEISVSEALDSKVIVNNIRSNTTSKFDSLLNNTKFKIDSLKALNLPHGKYAQKLDSLNHLKNLNNKISNLEESGKEKIEKIKNGFTGKLEIDKATGEIDKLDNKLPNSQDLPRSPVVGLGELEENLPVEEKIKGLKGRGKGLEILESEMLPDSPQISPETDLLSSTSAPNVESSLGIEGKVDGYKNETEKVIDLPKNKLEQVKDTEEISEMTSGIGEVKAYTDEAKVYQEDLTKAKDGDLTGVEKRAEEEAAKNIKGLEALQNQSGEFNQELDQLDNISDEAYIKQQMKEKALAVVTEKFEPNAEKLKQAQADFNRYKKKYAGIKDLKKNRGRSKPLTEKIIVGFDLEVGKNIATTLDFASILGYKFTNRFSGSFSYLYRFNFDNNKRSFIWEDPTYGGRGSFSYALGKGAFGKLALEQLRTNVPRGIIQSESSRQWVYGGFIGLGKGHKITKYLKGNIQALFNFLHDDKSPYSEKYNIRLGFEFNFKKRIERD